MPRFPPFSPQSRLLCVLCAAFAAGAFAADIRVGFVDSVEPGFFSQTVMPTMTSVARERTRDTISSVRLSPVLPISEIRQLRPDIIIAPAAVYVNAATEIGAHAIATRKTTFAKDPSRSVGAAVVVRADRSDLTTLADLRHKKAAAGNPDAVEGWLAFERELIESGIERKRFFSQVNFLGFTLPDVIMSVASGRTDAGILPACMLERAEAAGLIAPGVLRVIHEKKDDGLRCRHSTALYPDIVVAALPWTDPAVVRDVTLALLKLPENESYIWQVTSSFVNVTSLFKELHLGAWSYLDSWTPASIWRRFGAWICGVLGLILLVVLNELRLHSLVRRRTAMLTAALAERDAVMKREEEARLKLSKLERMGAISQLCAMIAHELKQPINSVVNYMMILRIKTEGSPLADDDIVQKALAGAEEESQRMAAIIDRVRGYARRDVNRSTDVRLDEAAARAFRHYSKNAAGTSRLEMPPMPEALISGNALEIELLVINLLKNADQAACENTGAVVRLTLEDVPEGWRLAVTDNGPPISDAAFARMMSISDSVKEDGLGLGLAIVRNIVDEHGAKLSVARLTPGGLSIAVTFDKLQPSGKAGPVL